MTLYNDTALFLFSANLVDMTSGSSSEDKEAIITSKSLTSYHINEYIVPILLVIGFLGNTMAIIVMQRKAFEKHTICLIITALAVSDNITCCMIPFNKAFVMQWLGYDIRSHDAVVCKVFFWFWRTSKLASSWFVALISVERFIAVWLPFRAREIITRKVVLNMIILNWCVWGVFNFFWGYLTDSLIDGKCQPNQSIDDNVVLERAFSLTGGSVYSIVPGIFILILNTLTIWKVVQQEKRRSNLTAAEANPNKSNTNETSKITIMLISISIAYIVLIVPVSLAH